MIVKERGALESAANKDVMCEVEGGTTIIRILAEGTKVKEGEIVCELDSASLKDLLTNQKITTQQAEASYKQALLVREVAEYAVKEYTEGIFKQEQETYKGEIALAESDLKRAEERLKWSSEMVIKGYVSKSSNVADKLSLDQCRFELEQAQTQLKVLLDYTKAKQIKSLSSDVEKARADELSKKSSLELEKTKEAKLERQIKACVLKAPGDGIVVFANESGRPGQTALQIEEGASVRERQKIFSLPDVTRMRVNTKVHESMVDRVKPGLRALIRVEAAAGQELRGQVASVAPMADANSFFGSDVKVYTTFVAIDGDTNKLNLRPGMNSQVEILITELDNVLSVPVLAVLEFKGKDYVFIKEGEGFRREEVALGISNDQHVEIKKGLKSGDLVALSPNSLLSDDERRDAFSVASKDASKRDFGGAAATGKGAGGPDAKAAPGEGAPKGEGKAKAKGKRGGGGAGGPGGMMGNPEERAKFLNASPEEQRKILEDRGVPADRIDAILERMKNGGGGGGGGPGGLGGPGGGPGGPGQ